MKLLALNANFGTMNFCLYRFKESFVWVVKMIDFCQYSQIKRDKRD